ncbi:Protein of unknown function [Pyronema omphalodes CBS 100304]|uniref:Uncharacterized protein n=1 Tax=Pyronema omphalodes (strain CBS 100304) TaxID=1076935 RepID=U4L8P0_PYROM|nr:Protein of unknown function [Pyronema omphalodes CBS 100304]
MCRHSDTYRITSNDMISVFAVGTADALLTSWDTDLSFIWRAS